LSLGILPSNEFVNNFGKSGYAVIKTDARGSGASFGFQRIEWAPEEVAVIAFHI
jgi:predicted acyl esterase